MKEVIAASRHVLATTLTTIGGFLPFLIWIGGDFWPPLAIVLAGGVSGATLIVLDIPLLFESRAAGTGGTSAMDFDATILVWVPRETQIERQVARDGHSREEAERRVGLG